MPLPKTSTIAARATEVYCEVWSVILQRTCKMPPTRDTDLNDLSQLLPYLRQLLTCCACAGLLDNAMISLTCGHCYCFKCQFQEPLLKIQCRQCRERTGLVMESQLQLVVTCYKHMCHVIGEELRNNPTALGTIVKDEPVAVTTAAKLNIKIPTDEMETNEDLNVASPDESTVPSKKESTVPSKKESTISSKKEGAVPSKKEGTISSKKESTVPSKKEDTIPSKKEDTVTLKKESTVQSKVLTVPLKKESMVPSKKEGTIPPPNKKIAVLVDPNFDPIAEIVREVEKGMKVSRAILVIKPPLKYLCTKVAAPLRVPLKVPLKVPLRAPIKKEVTVSPPSPSTDVSPLTPPAQTPLSTTDDGERIPDIPPAKGDDGCGLETRKRRGKVSGKLDRLSRAVKSRSHKKGAAVCNEGRVAVNTTAKRKLGERKPLSLSLRRNQSNMAKKKRLVSNTVAKVTTKSPLKASKVVDKSSKVVDEGCDSPPIPSESPESPALQPAQIHFICGGEIELSDLAVSVRCLDDGYLKVTSKAVSLLPEAQPAHVLSGALSQHSSHTTTTAKKTSFVGGAWRQTVQRRRWGPLCPSVVVKRSREVIAKILIQQSKAAKGKRKARHNNVKQRKQVAEQSTKKTATTTTKKPCSRESALLVSTLPSQPVAVPSPPPSFSHHPGDIPLPDNIPLLPGDGSQMMLEDDIDWKELSDFLESNDEESLSSLPPPLSCYPGPPPPPPPHQHPVQPLHYDNHFRPRHLLHAAFMPPPHPGHLHFPPHLPPPPPGPHTPVLPFPPDMRPDMSPDGFFPGPPPMMAQEDFLHGPGGGGYSSPMTPQGYSAGGMCPMEFQNSPRHHHHHLHPHHHPGAHGHFPMPSPRMGFPPPGPLFPRTPITLPKQHKTGSMAKMVGKMKIKAPVQQPQQPKKPPRKKLLPPATPGEQGGKKRRSPGYSEAGWRCRCGTNNVMFPDKVCAKGKCPCYTKGVACKNCLCRHCHNPFGPRDQEGCVSLPADGVVSDAIISDAVVSDAVVSDAVVSDAVVSDAVVSDAVVSDAVVSDAVLADAVVSDAVVSEQSSE